MTEEEFQAVKWLLDREKAAQTTRGLAKEGGSISWRQNVFDVEWLEEPVRTIASDLMARLNLD